VTSWANKRGQMPVASVAIDGHTRLRLCSAGRVFGDDDDDVDGLDGLNCCGLVVLWYIQQQRRTERLYKGMEWIGNGTWVVDELQARC
jgi:hypothetical protein